MKMPTIKTRFLPIQEIIKYTDSRKYHCCSVVFSPETENNHFKGCPPYIEIRENDKWDDESIYFEIPEIVSYYAKTHPCYTMKGTENHKKQGRLELINELKNLLEIE